MSRKIRFKIDLKQDGLGLSTIGDSTGGEENKRNKKR